MQPNSLCLVAVDLALERGIFTRHGLQVETLNVVGDRRHPGRGGARPRRRHLQQHPSFHQAAGGRLRRQGHGRHPGRLLLPGGLARLARHQLRRRAQQGRAVHSRLQRRQAPNRATAQEFDEMLRNHPNDERAVVVGDALRRPMVSYAEDLRSFGIAKAGTDPETFARRVTSDGLA
jgi:hypothetical protein